LQGFFFNKFTMPKKKKQEKLKLKNEETIDMALNKPSSKCREFFVDLLAIFYEAESNLALE
jgi:hypothetical protein